MNKKNVLLTTVLSAGLVPMAAGMAEAAIVQAIDPLTATQTVTRTQGSGTTVSNLANLPGTILSNNPLNTNVTRRLSLLKQSGVGPGTANIPTANFGPGLDFSNNAGVNSRLTLEYRGTLAGGRFRPVDFTVGGLADRITLGIILNDVALGENTNFSVTLGSGTSTFTKAFLSNVDYSNPNNPLPIDFLFSDFTGINAAAINSFSITIDPPANGDVSLKFLGVGNAMTTPEPTALLGLLAVAGATVTMRKKQLQSK